MQPAPITSPDPHRFVEAGPFVVIGAAGGIGGAVCRGLAAAGAKVVAAGRSGASLDEIAAECDAICVELDARRFDDVERCLAELPGEQPPAGVVNCAGTVLLKPAHLTTPDEWSETVAANLTTGFATVRAAGKVMRAGGSVVLVSSVAAEVGLANHEAIAAVKGGISALVRSAAATYAGRGLRFNAVAPGLVETPLTERITSSARALESSTAMHPLGRIGRPEDVASAILWLLDPANNWVTGQVLGIDGGMGRTRASAAKRAG
jgi:NAD(P)-dependent dehydrogenase (short-subunit alcohol dehydrogenase family)